MCKHDDCNKKVRCKGLCQTHYYKMMYPSYKDRTEYIIKTDSEAFTDGFWTFVKKELNLK